MRTITNVPRTEDIRWLVVWFRFDIAAKRCKKKPSEISSSNEQGRRKKRVTRSWARVTLTSRLIMYMWHHREICRVEVINCWTVKHRISIAKQSFPGPRECIPRNRVAVVRTPLRGAFLPSVLVAASYSSSASFSLFHCSEVSLCEFWIYENKQANFKIKCTISSIVHLILQFCVRGHNPRTAIKGFP